MAKANSPSENVRALQRALYVAAKRNGRRKFPALLDRVARPVVLQDAWKQVRRNEGAAGIDGETLAAVEAYGVERMLEELRELLLTADPAADESHLAVDVEHLWPCPRRALGKGGKAPRHHRSLCGRWCDFV